jgi:small GTP-binding protein
VVIRNTSVSKTATLTKYIRDTFQDQGAPTVSGEYFDKMFARKTHRIQVQIWDTAGQEKFRSITRRFYRDCAGALLVYDLLSEDSFSSLGQWLEDARQEARDDLVAVVLENKLDLLKEKGEEVRAVSIEKVEEFAETHNLRQWEVSAKTGEGLGEAFDHLVSELEKVIDSGDSHFALPVHTQEEVIALADELPPQHPGCAC